MRISLPPGKKQGSFSFRPRIRPARPDIPQSDQAFALASLSGLAGKIFSLPSCLAGTWQGNATAEDETALRRPSTAAFSTEATAPITSAIDRMAKVRTKINASMASLISCYHGNFVGCEPGGGKHG